MIVRVYEAGEDLKAAQIEIGAVDFHSRNSYSRNQHATKIAGSRQASSNRSSRPAFSKISRSGSPRQGSIKRDNLKFGGRKVHERVRRVRDLDDVSAVAERSRPAALQRVRMHVADQQHAAGTRNPRQLRETLGSIAQSERTNRNDPPSRRAVEAASHRLERLGRISIQKSRAMECAPRSRQ